MKNQFWFGVGLAALLGSCGDEAHQPNPSVAQDVMVQEPATAEVLVEAPIEAPLASPLAKYAKARGLSASEPRGPNKHYRVVGDVVFHIEDQEVPQDGELLLGGGARMQFTLKREGFYPNTFLLASPEECWVRFHNKEFEDYEALDLWKESLMRWHTLRFPWGWQDADLGEFTIETELGVLTLEVNEEHLPSRISMRDSHVALSDWRAASNGPALYPMHWDWTYESGRRVESFTSIHDRALFVDSAFTPKTSARDYTYLISPEDDAITSSEYLDFLRITWQSVSKGEWMDSSSGAPGVWYEHQGEPRYVFAPGIEPQPGAKVLEERDWLVWSTMQNLNSDDALEYLNSILPQLKATRDGELWSHIPDEGIANRRVFVLPVIRQ